MRSNNVLNMQKYMIGVVVFGLFPVFYCILHYMNDVIDYIQLDDDTDVEDTEIKVWQVTYFVVLSMHPKTNFNFLLESSIWTSMVWFCICCNSDSRILTSFCMEFDKCMEI